MNFPFVVKQQAFIILDLYLNKKKIEISLLQLLGMCCMLISLKVTKLFFYNLFSKEQYKSDSNYK